jgi:hypothetical protein
VKSPQKTCGLSPIFVTPDRVHGDDGTHGGGSMSIWNLFSRDHVTPAEQNRRLAVCQSCPNLSARGRCRLCLCPVLRKTIKRRERCPQGRW